MTEKLWLITLSPTEQIIVKAETCDVWRNGALVFMGGPSLAIKMIIAPGQWVMVEREQEEEKRE